MLPPFTSFNNQQPFTMLKDAFCMRIALLLFISINLIACSKKSLVFETKSVNQDVAKDDKEYFVFENDTIRMVYTFWSNQGSMAFSIYNKLKVPLYINWKRSSLVLNAQKTDYWTDETVVSLRKTTKNNAATVAYGVNSPLYQLMSLTAMSTVSYVQQNVIKPEKVTFIAPQSYIFKAKDGLISSKLPTSSFSWQKESFNSKSGKKKVKGESVKFAENNTPIVFRNFLSISTSEEFANEDYIDHTFYINKLIRVNAKDVSSTGYDKQQKKYVTTYFFYRPTNFYLE